ncbi:MAG: hypothetical protein Pg6A_07310 [Termitinemataceae bacterium]|nr:MAG: hypothetical protein Pg6A_07310 [Termitinemataceae bacterium]
MAILIVASFEKGRGGGHLMRCCGIVRELRELGREAWLFIAGNRGIEDARQIAGNGLDALLIPEHKIFKQNWDFAVLDRFATPAAELRRYQALCPVIGIDEGGKKRHEFDFLFDVLPGLSSRSEANYCSAALLTLPKNQKPLAFPAFYLQNAKILVCFGAENAKNLSFYTANALKPLAAAQITVVSAGKKMPVLWNNAIIESIIPNLREKLAGFDLVITHFGICAFESIAVGTPVALISPSQYHEKLALNAGFFSFGIKKRGVAALGRFCRAKNPNSNKIISASCAARQKIAAGGIGAENSICGEKKFAAVLAALKPQVFKKCPVCGTDFIKHRTEKVIARFAERSYRLCGYCRTISMNRAAPPDISYSDAYFFEDYEKQYGKTYLEDFLHIKALGKTRLKHICSIASGKRLLDIGCAYGPFLAAAREAGYDVQGADASSSAVSYVKESLGINARYGFFPAVFEGEPPGSFDVITMWFVIEHLRETGAALRRIHELLAKDGVFAFSTPSSSGVSGCFLPRRFLEQSPADHWTIFNPRRIRRVLGRAGFKTRKIVSTGHHGERLPLFGKFFAEGKGAKIWRGISSFFLLGDTFEVYAQKR